jgi:hypothetical protein
VVVAFDFRYASDYTMVGDMFLLVINRLYKGLMLEVDDE